MRRVSAMVITATLAAACSNSGSRAGDPIVEAWRSDGLEVERLAPFESAELATAQSCERGILEELEVTLCRFADSFQATDSRRAGLSIIGKHTGVALVEGSYLLVVVDRDGADKRGKNINLIAKRFSETAGEASAARTTTEVAGESSPPSPFAKAMGQNQGNP